MMCIHENSVESGEDPARARLFPGCGRCRAAGFSNRLFAFLLLVGGLFYTTPDSEALALLSPPEFTRAPKAPLSGVLTVVTDEPSRVTVRVNDGMGEWERRFFQYDTHHSLPLHGFKPGRSNVITVTVHDRERNQVTAGETLVFVTSPLPVEFPNIRLQKAEPERMEPGFTLFRVDVQFTAYDYVVILDQAGEVVWYDETPSTADVRQLENGNLFMPTLSNFLEMNLLAEEVRTWTPPTQLAIDPHDGVLTDHGTILYLAHATNSVTEYPTSVTNPEAPTATAKVYYQKFVELSLANSAVLQTWDPLHVLDPRRISYLVGRISRGWDAHHSNAIIEDPKDGDLIVSMRHQHAVVKFDRETGAIRWILGPHENWGPDWQPYLLTPVGTPFEWQYAQHAPVPTPEGTLVIYDNGNDRALPFDSKLPDEQNYTRAVEYEINEETMEVRQVWEYGKNAEERLYTPFKGNASPLPKTGNVLIGFSAVTLVNGVSPSPTGAGTMVRIQEVTREAEAEVVWDVAMTMYDREGSTHNSCSIYRAVRIPDLYGHPAAAVEDLMLRVTAEDRILQFSADPFRSYRIESSADLATWAFAGIPTEDPASPGEFNFQDVSPGGARYYRVVTE